MCGRCTDGCSSLKGLKCVLCLSRSMSWKTVIDGFYVCGLETELRKDSYHVVREWGILEFTKHTRNNKRLFFSTAGQSAVSSISLFPADSTHTSLDTLQSHPLCFKYGHVLHRKRSATLSKYHPVTWPCWNVLFRGQTSYFWLNKDSFQYSRCHPWINSLQSTWALTSSYAKGNNIFCAVVWRCETWVRWRKVCEKWGQCLKAKITCFLLLKKYTCVWMCLIEYRI